MAGTFTTNIVSEFHALSNHRMAVFLLILITVVITWYLTKQSCSTKSSFMDRSSHGYRYDTTTLSFATKEDRQLGITALSDLMESTYTVQQLAPLSDSFIIRILDSEDETELTELKSRLVILIDPTYKVVLSAVNKALVTTGVFENASVRQITYDLLVKYFNARNTPITVNMSKWTDALIISTFKTLRLPDPSKYSS